MEQTISDIANSPSPTLPKKNIYKTLFFIMLAIVVMGGLTMTAYYFGKNQDRSTTKIAPSPTAATPSPTAASTLVPSQSAPPPQDANIVPITDNTVSFTRSGEQTYLRYRGKVYDDSDTVTPKEVPAMANPVAQTWYGLVEAPSFVKPNEFMMDEVFSFKVAPDKKSFAFVMRWGDSNSPDKESKYYLYSYNFSTTPKFKLVDTFHKIEQHPTVPKILSFSADSVYLALNMYPCWNCGGSIEDTYLIGLLSGHGLHLQHVSYFNWKENGAYEYKEFIPISCHPTPPQEVMGVCFEDPASLPMKTGQMTQ